MDIEIPQPTVLERLERDLEDAKRRLKDTPEELEASQYTESGYIKGLSWAIEVIKLNQ